MIYNRIQDITSSARKTWFDHHPIRISHLQGMQFTTNSSTPSMCWLVWQWDSWIHKLNSIWLICWTPHVFISISFWLLLSFCPSFNLLPSRDAVGDQFQHNLDVLSGITRILMNLQCQGFLSGLLYYNVTWSYFLCAYFIGSLLRAKENHHHLDFAYWGKSQFGVSLNARGVILRQLTCQNMSMG